MNHKGSGQLLLIAVVIVAVIIGGFYLKFSKFQNTSNISQVDQLNPSPSVTPTPHPEANSLDIPNRHSKISWKVTQIKDKPIYLHFDGKEFGGEIPLTGQLLEGEITDNPENNTLIEDYYRSNLEKQLWVRKILQTPEYRLGIIGHAHGGFACEYRETYVFMGYRDDMLRLIKIDSEVNPETKCSEAAPAPSVFSGKRDIQYHIFISDPLPLDVVRLKEFEIS